MTKKLHYYPSRAGSIETAHFTNKYRQHLFSVHNIRLKQVSNKPTNSTGRYGTSPKITYRVLASQ